MLCNSIGIIPGRLSFQEKKYSRMINIPGEENIQEEYNIQEKKYSRMIFIPGKENIQEKTL